MANDRKETVGQLAHDKWEREGMPDGWRMQNRQEPEAESQAGNLWSQLTPPGEDGHGQGKVTPVGMAADRMDLGESGLIKPLQ